MFTMHNERLAMPRPVILLAVATFLGLYCSLLFGTDTRIQELAGSPRPLPDDMDVIARPMSPGSPLFVLRRAIAAHNSGRHRDALRSWRQLDTQYELAAWKHLGIGVANLYEGNLSAAARELQIALVAEPENAAVHYFTGLLRREQAEFAMDYPDSERTSVIRFASLTPAECDPAEGKTRSRLLLEAIDELTLAIQLAHELDLGQPLIADICGNQNTLAREPQTSPTVSELLDSLGADNFVGKAHGLLAHLYLDRDRPEEAEAHVDHAEMQGISVPGGYRLVGDQYEAQGRVKDAIRADQKATRRGDHLAKLGVSVSEVMRNAFEDLLR